jgi:hypothetical protein
MFYTNKVLFIHIPRTGGTWLTEFAHRMFDASLDVHHLKHASLEDVYAAIPGTSSLEPFAITRDPRDIAMSFYSLALSSNGGDASLCTPQWLEVVEAVSRMTLEEFMESDLNPARRQYYETPVREFRYEMPMKEVIRWLIDVHFRAGRLI